MPITDIGLPAMHTYVIDPRLERAYFYVHYGTGTTPTSAAQADQIWRGYDSYHRTKGWGGIGYNLGVDPATGRVLMGRGLHAVGCHCPGYNRTGYGVCVLGDPSQVTAEIASGLREAYQVCCTDAGRPLTVRVHSDSYQTSCPGPVLTPWVKAGHITESEEDDMTPDQDRALARCLQILEAADVTIHDQTRGPLAQAAAKINGRTNEARRKDGTPLLYACQGDVDALLAEIAALRGAVGALATSQGLDGPAITQTVTDAVHDALAGLEVTLTTKED